MNIRSRVLAVIGATGMLAVVAGTAFGATGKKVAPKAPTSLVCPVLGTKIASIKDSEGKSVYKGKTYYFCCEGCKPMFDKDPAKYVQKMSSMKPGAAHPGM